MGPACRPHDYIYIKCWIAQDKTKPDGMCCYRHRLYCYCLDCQIFDNLNHVQVWYDIYQELGQASIQDDDETVVPALISEMIDAFAHARRVVYDYNGKKLYNGVPVYLSIEAIFAAMLTGFLQQVGEFLTPKEFALICNERALRSSVVLTQANQHLNDGGPRLPAHHGPATLQLLVPKDSSHSVITVRTILEDEQHCLKIALPLKEDLHLAVSVAGYSPVVVTPQLRVKLTDGVPHTLVNVMLDMKNETLDVTLVKDGQFYCLVIEFE